MASAASTCPSARSTRTATTTRCAPRLRASSARTCCTRCGCRFTTQESDADVALARRRRSSCSTPSRRAAPASRAVARTGRFELAENLDFNVGRKQQMRVGYPARGRTLQELRRDKRRGTLHLLGSIEAFNDEPADARSRSALARWTPRSRSTTSGFYWSDDIRLNNKFSFGIGVRNEMQSHIDDKSEPDAARRIHLDAVGQRHGDPRRLRALLRLVRIEPLRPDAARQRHRAARHC